MKKKKALSYALGNSIGYTPMKLKHPKGHAKLSGGLMVDGGNASRSTLSLKKKKNRGVDTNTENDI